MGGEERGAATFFQWGAFPPRLPPFAGKAGEWRSHSPRKLFGGTFFDYYSLCDSFPIHPFRAGAVVSQGGGGGMVPLRAGGTGAGRDHQPAGGRAASAAAGKAGRCAGLFVLYLELGGHPAAAAPGGGARAGNAHFTGRTGGELPGGGNPAGFSHGDGGTGGRGGARLYPDSRPAGGGQGAHRDPGGI